MIAYLETDKDAIDLSMTLAEGQSQKIEIVNLARTKPLSVTGTIVLKKGAKLELAEADLGRFDVNFKVTVVCEGDDSSFVAHVGALNEDKEKKIYAADVIHLGKRSYSRTSMYGVCDKESAMSFLGSSDIKKGAAKTNTRQEGKIINLSGKAKCVVSPALLIAEEDVFASHGATMGSIPDQDIYYLMSRGLDKKTAERLVVMGYLKPIVLLIEDASLKEKAIALLERSL